MPRQLACLIAVARDQQPADLLLTNARVVNVFNGEIEAGNVAICGDSIAGVGDYRQAKQIIDLEGGYLLPGLINGHTHLESSLLDVGQYARAVIPQGTLGVVTDLHEIANVAGTAGIKYVLDYARRLPFEFFLMAPSCVPATHLETSGASLGVAEVRQILRWKNVIGLGEMMNFPGVLAGSDDVLDKIELARQKVVDGHAPGLSGKDLNAYIAAGISSDHESVALKEAREKLAKGMYIMIREGSSEKNLDALLPLVTDKTYKRCLFVVDDRSCVDLLQDGDIVAVVRQAIRRGLDPLRVIQLATINPAERFKLDKVGAVAPGYLANLLVTSDLKDLQISMVFHCGKLVARNGEPLFSLPEVDNALLTHSINLKPFDIDALKLAAHDARMPVIGIVPGQIITRHLTEQVKTQDGFVLSDVERDILKLVVVERHHASGTIGLGLVHGFGLKRGALASSVAHDSHNIIAVGASDADIYFAVKQVEKMQGGLVAVADAKFLASLPLPVAGLLSPEPLEIVASRLEKLEQVARELGSSLSSPFATLSFLALPVIPELKLTDLGLVDVLKFNIIKPGRRL